MELQKPSSFQKFIAFFLLAVISFFILPKELIHASHHSDTEDVICMDACKDHVSNTHEHCDVLQLTAPPLYHQIEGYSFFAVSFTFSFLVKNTSDYFSLRSPALCLRGPPAIA